MGMFDAVDSKQGAARGWIGSAQFTDWATTHIAGKIAEIDTQSEVDFYHVANYAEADFLKAIEVAVTNKNSREYASLYEFLLTPSLRQIPLAVVRLPTLSSTSLSRGQQPCHAHSAWPLLMAPPRAARQSSSQWMTPRLD